MRVVEWVFALRYISTNKAISCH